MFPPYRKMILSADDSLQTYMNISARFFIRSTRYGFIYKQLSLNYSCVFLYIEDMNMSHCITKYSVIFCGCSVNLLLHCENHPFLYILCFLAIISLPLIVFSNIIIRYSAHLVLLADIFVAGDVVIESIYNITLNFYLYSYVINGKHTRGKVFKY